MTKAHTKSEIISFRTPTEPFQTWQVDLFGPLPITQKERIYFTAVDMFSKLLFCVPLLSSDSVTVSHALFQLVCTFGVCDCVISDQGSKFISQCTDQLCKILEVNQNFTPSFIHHCLGLCERTHRTVAERLTPYTKKGIQAITNSEPTSNVVSDEPNSEPSVNNNLRTRPVRQIRQPMRYRSELGNISESTLADTLSSEQTDNTFYKVKRILAQRKRNECYEYLVQYKGEPAQNAIWTVENQLNEAAKQSIIKRPPPVID
ncbi:unnamed protein product [Mytilus coruscus]|uniref:Integrase catalytic domain-containing protein n=1 Tax=Mytilus coruscus TaxID=42192 RepID=A0A6J8AWC1_MYTCO|nr:unnamed protein product [Mytilus coruscus]